MITLKDDIDLSSVDVVILAGGLGTRLQSVVKNKPKCLAQINNKIFIDILLDDCIEQGLYRFIICVGYLKEQVIDHLSQRVDCEIIFSIEHTQLGTAGALKNAEKLINSNTFIVLNGDSQIDCSYLDLLKFHHKKKSDASMLLSINTEGEDYGHVRINADNRIESFNEKIKYSNFFLVSAGVYCINRKLLLSILPKKNISLENNIFEKWINTYRFFGKTTKSIIYDIGTPERFDIYQEKLK